MEMEVQGEEVDSVILSFEENFLEKIYFSWKDLLHQTIRKKKKMQKTNYLFDFCFLLFLFCFVFIYLVANLPY